MNLTDLSVKEFLEETASSSPAPGGGSVSALAGALSAALAAMVARLTEGEKYAAVRGEMRRIAAEAEKLKGALSECVQKDTDGFSEYMAALKLPKDTEKNIALRRAAMQNGLKKAALVPLETAHTAAEIFPLAAAAAKQGNPNALSDALVAALLAKAAVCGALLNVRVNLAAVEDGAFTEKIAAQIEDLAARAKEGERLLSEIPLAAGLL